MVSREGTLHSPGDGLLRGAVHLLAVDAESCNELPRASARCITQSSKGIAFRFTHVSLLLVDVDVANGASQVISKIQVISI